MRTDNRASLLAGARACLDARGYARTRARDVAAAAGVSTAAIGYHFGTTDALLVAALLDGLEEWSEGLGRQLAELPEQDPSQRAVEAYACVVASFEGHRGVLAASFELIAQADEKPAVRKQLQHALELARGSLAQQLAGVDSEREPQRAQDLGAVCYALLSGLLVQWLVDPAGLPGPAALQAAIAPLLRDLRA